MAFDERSHLEECAKKPPQRNVCGHYRSTHRLSILSSHLYRRADIALIGLAVMVSLSVCVNVSDVYKTFWITMLSKIALHSLLLIISQQPLNISWINY